MSTCFFTVQTPDGPFTALLEGETVLASGWTSSLDKVIGRIHPLLRAKLGKPAKRSDTDAERAVLAFYDGDFAAPLSVEVFQEGGTFRTRAWTALRDIPAGHTRTYRELAQRLGSPNGARAVAGACASNAPVLFVPCHRVIRTDGTLGGFAWGLAVKSALLRRESSL